MGWPFGPYVNHNHYGGMMEMLIPISAAYLLSRRTESAMRWVLWPLMAVPLVSVLLSASRGAMGVLLVEGLLLAFLAGCYPGSSRTAREQELPPPVAQVDEVIVSVPDSL